MLKAVGALLVVLSCGAMGYGKSLSYTKRQRELEEIQKMLYFLLGEITYRREALPGGTSLFDWKRKQGILC